MYLLAYKHSNPWTCMFIKYRNQSLVIYMFSFPSFYPWHDMWGAVGSPGSRTSLDFFFSFHDQIIPIAFSFTNSIWISLWTPMLMPPLVHVFHSQKWLLTAWFCQQTLPFWSLGLSQFFNLNKPYTVHISMHLFQEIDFFWSCSELREPVWCVFGSTWLFNS